ncbi:MAG TPA: ATP-binding protein [Thermoanaerobaculaceae bacterium]|nr:ATP-binding protein [Thermoanaerobaculaceae bacterium]
MSEDRPSTDLASLEDSRTLRDQESILILLNLCLLTAIAVVHVLFGPALGPPSRGFFVVLMGRFLMQTLELAWLNGGQVAPDVHSLRTYAGASIWVNIAFAFVIALLGGKEETHYVVLMVIPVIAAAFRYGATGIAVVVAATTGLTFLEVWIYYRRHLPMGTTEYFEATNVVLVYGVVAPVVALLVGRLRREQGKLRHSLAELERARDRLVSEEKLAAVGRFASAIAHEVRNPVAMIVSSLELAKDASTDPARRDEWREVAGTEARRLEALTGDFLLYARQRKPEKRRTPVATTVGYVAGLAQARLSQAGLRLTVQCAEDLVAPFDPFQVHQALLNLMMNACDATPSGGSITMGARPVPGGGVVLFVENNGPAISEDVVPKLFEPFFTTKPRGSGLGLAISRAIARGHGGDLVLEVNKPGRVRLALNIPADPAVVLEG